MDEDASGKIKMLYDNEYNGGARGLLIGRHVLDDQQALAPSEESFALEVEEQFTSAVQLDELLKLSRGLQTQFRDALTSNVHCMLPSYNHLLPHGGESGTYLTLDVGGSTFRVAMIELRNEANDEEMKIVALESYRIDESVKSLKGHLFFDWMVDKIRITISGKYDLGAKSLSLGLAWSFPIE